jgi:vitamin B12 transporter
VLYPDAFSSLNNYAYNTTLSYEGATADKSLSWLVNYTYAKHALKSGSFRDRNDPMGYAPYYPVQGGWRHTRADMDQLQVQMTYDHPMFSLTPGFEYVKYEGELTTNSSPIPSRSRFTNSSGYLIGKLRLLDGDLILSAGGRYDNMELTNYTSPAYNERKFTTSFGIAYSPVDFLKLRVNYATGFSVPNADQIFGDGSSYLPSPNLKPQENKTFEFGADLSYEHLDASITYFISEFKNKFVAVGTTTPNSWGGTYSVFRNLDGASLAGLELALKYDIGKALGQEFSLSPYVNLTWMTRRKNKDRITFVEINPEILPNSPKVLASYGVNFDHPGIGLNANINASYIGSRYVQDWYDPDVLASYYMLPAPWLVHKGFTVVDLSFTKTLADFQEKGVLKLKGQVGNVFDAAKGYAHGVTIPGRNFYLGLTYGF